VKRRLFVVIFAAVLAVLAYCKGSSEMDLVNTQEIELGQISNVEISSLDRDVFLYMGDSDVFVIKDYMNKNNNDYYAQIANSDNVLKIKSGRKPVFGILMIGFKARLEVYLPKSYSKKVGIKTSDGNIECSIADPVNDIVLTAEDGNISLNIPRNYVFNFTARISDGKLNTPFSEKLASPVSDKDLIQGVIGMENNSNNMPIHNINLTTKDGSILINWIN
jgi:hypothetical protein